MRKTDKKRDNALREALTEVCETAIDRFDGFVWLTHFANYQQFPASLSILCVFATNEQLAAADKPDLCHLFDTRLRGMDIQLKSIQQHVSFDTEEDCLMQHSGNWNKRLQRQ